MKRIKFGLVTLVLILVLLAVLSACGGQTPASTSTTTPTSTPKTTPVSQSDNMPSPSLLIMSPQSGFISETGDVTINVKIVSFNLVEKVGQSNVAGEGHIIYYLDVEIPKTPGEPALTEPGTYAATTANSYTWHELSAGSHILRVQLVNNDNTPLSEPVFASVGITVKQ
jgi:ABC-type glycerol-3-phosphate transport system substrate-binding protein